MASRVFVCVVLIAAILVSGCREDEPDETIGVTPIRGVEVPDDALGLRAMKLPPSDYLSKIGTGTYRFLVAGHAYGAHKANSLGLFPPLKKALGQFNRADFLVLTGDVVRSANPISYGALETDLDFVGIPAFVAPGNHDGAKGSISLFFKRYGTTRSSFAVGKDAFVICNTNESAGNIGSRDVDAIKKVLAAEPRSLFIFVHHLVWIDVEQGEKDPSLKKAVNALTEGAGYARRGEFASRVLPLLKKAQCPVFVVAGDVGAGADVIESYQKVAPNVHLMAAGMGDHLDVGAWLECWVDDKGVTWRTEYLTTTPRHHPEGVERIGTRTILFSK